MDLLAVEGEEVEKLEHLSDEGDGRFLKSYICFSIFTGNLALKSMKINFIQYFNIHSFIDLNKSISSNLYNL